VDNVYNKASEFGIRYDSPEINVNWGIPADKIITSEKDRLANTLADLQKRQRG
jgi:dTDP-4-dehydrorhamnose 3,5-epimerase